MLDHILAERILNKLYDYAEYHSMEISDRKGNILASTQSERIGTRDPAVVRFVRSNQESFLQQEEADIQRSYFWIGKGRKKEAVLGIEGIWDESYIKGLSVAASVIFDYEEEKEGQGPWISKKEHFMNLLLYQEPFSVEEIQSAAGLLKIREDLTRVPVLIDMKTERRELPELYRKFLGDASLTEQDLVWVMGESGFILFKTVECPEKKFMQEYKYILAETLSPFLHCMRNRGIRYNLYVGPAQNTFSNYRQAGSYCEWMRDNIKKDGSFYFYDYVITYLESTAPLHEMHTVFGVLKEKMGEKLIQSYMETMEILIDKDYNLNKASESLHIHKNTMVYRLDKIRESLNMNPLLFNADREFMEGFYFYLKRIEK